MQNPARGVLFEGPRHGGKVRLRDLRVGVERKDHATVDGLRIVRTDEGVHAELARRADSAGKIWGVKNKERSVAARRKQIERRPRCRVVRVGGVVDDDDQRDGEAGVLPRRVERIQRRGKFGGLVVGGDHRRVRKICADAGLRPASAQILFEDPPFHPEWDHFFGARYSCSGLPSIRRSFTA